MKKRASLSGMRWGPRATLKSIPEPQRSAKIREAEEALIRRWGGNKGQKGTKSDTKSIRRRRQGSKQPSFP